jgi:hypothetical protein
MSYTAATGMIVAQIMALPEFARICALHPEAGLDEAMLTEIVGSAGTLAQDVIAPFNRRADAQGCRLDNGRVRLRRAITRRGRPLSKAAGR